MATWTKHDEQFGFRASFRAYPPAHGNGKSTSTLNRQGRKPLPSGDDPILKSSQSREIQKNWSIHWIGLRENLQESPIFHGKIYGFLLRFSQQNHIHWSIQKKEKTPDPTKNPKKFIEHPSFRRPTILQNYAPERPWPWLTWEESEIDVQMSPRWWANAYRLRCWML